MLVVNFWIIILSVGRRKKSFKFPLTEYFFKNLWGKSFKNIQNQFGSYKHTFWNIFFLGELPLYKTSLGKVITQCSVLFHIWLGSSTVPFKEEVILTVIQSAGSLQMNK